MKYKYIYYNRISKKTEEIYLKKEVFDGVRRSKWKIKNDNRKFYKNETTIFNIREIDNIFSVVNINYYKNPEHIYIEKENLMRLKEAILKLNKEERNIIIKRYYHNIKISKIAKESKLGWSTIKEREIKILKKIKNFLKTP